MAVASQTLTTRWSSLRAWLARAWQPYRPVPLLGWLAAILIAVIIERAIGAPVARALGMSRVPALFGFIIMLKNPDLLFSALLYVLLIYLLPIAQVARLSVKPANRIAGKLIGSSVTVSSLAHLGVLYAALFLWSGESDYRLLIAKLAMIAIITTLSLNVVNGYLGEFSCSHPGFMALGAYTASVITVLLFVDDNLLGEALLPPELGPFMFPIALIIGGAVAAVGSLVVAIPSFRTRGDYLAIISLAFMFIVKSLFENLEVFGGPRGLANQPNYASLTTIFIWTIACIWVINNFVRSTMGKALNAVRDGEMAADAMTVNTRRTKMTAFLFAAFWAGVAGGLLAHVIRYINPDTFGIRRLAEVLAMVYLGGLNAVAGSIVGAVGFVTMSEALRPLEILKWIMIPVLLILVMIFRPTGLIAFREFEPEKFLRPKVESNDQGKRQPQPAQSVGDRQQG